MNLTLSCESVQVDANNYKRVSADINDVEKSEVLDQFDLQDIIDHFEVSKILDEIGMETVMDHFDLVNPNE